MLAELRDARRYALGVYRDRVDGLVTTMDAVSAGLEAAAAC